MLHNTIRSCVFSIGLVGLPPCLQGCASLSAPSSRSLGIDQLARGYQPIDPEPVFLVPNNVTIGATDPEQAIRDAIRAALSNTLTRIAIGRLDTTGTVRFGPVEVGQAGESYVVVVDRIMYTTSSVDIEYLLADLDVTSELTRQLARLADNKDLARGIRSIPTDLSVQLMFDGLAGEYMSLYSKVGNDRLQVLLSFVQSETDFAYLADELGSKGVQAFYDKIGVLLQDEMSTNQAPPSTAPVNTAESSDTMRDEFASTREVAQATTDAATLSHGDASKGRDDNMYSVPVYIGVGVRMRFELSVLSGEVNLTSYGGFGGDAGANRVQGTVTLQTIGLSGPAIAELTPLPIDISDVSVPVMVQALIAIYSKIYTDAVSLRPQVIGFDSPAVLPGGAAYLESVVRSRRYTLAFNEGVAQVTKDRKTPDPVNQQYERMAVPKIDSKHD